MSIRRLSIAARQSVKRVAYSVSPCHNTDLNKLTERLVAMVEETMQSAHVSLWLTSPPNPLSQWERGKGAGGIGGEV